MNLTQTHIRIRFCKIAGTVWIVIASLTSIVEPRVTEADNTTFPPRPLSQPIHGSGGFPRSSRRSMPTVLVRACDNNNKRTNQDSQRIFGKSLYCPLSSRQRLTVCHGQNTTVWSGHFGALVSGVL